VWGRGRGAINKIYEWCVVKEREGEQIFLHPATGKNAGKRESVYSRYLKEWLRKGKRGERKGRGGREDLLLSSFCFEGLRRGGKGGAIFGVFR